MLIKMIKGGFGYKENAYVVLKTAKDKPFEVDETIAKRLCEELGVAEYVKEEKADSNPNCNNGKDDTTGEKEKLVARFKELGGKGPATTWKLETLKSKIEELENKKQTSDSDDDTDTDIDTDSDDDTDTDIDTDSDVDTNNNNDEIEGEIESDDAAPDLSGENGVA